MKTTVSLHDFRDAFRKADRTTNFSYDGLEILFEYFEQLEDDLGEEIEFDVIAICCEYAEDDLEYISNQYSIDIDGLSDEEAFVKVRDYLEENGAYVGATDLALIVYRQF